MTMTAHKATQFIQMTSPTTKPKVGIILGSGLGDLVQQLENSTVIPYSQIPGFPTCSVEGHGSKLHLGHLFQTPVACFEGRPHLYEGTTNEQFKTFVRTIKLIGCDTLLITNSAGSLNRDVPTGHLVLIKDHVNLQFKNPLVGPNEDEFGPRFTGMDEVYDANLRAAFLSTAKTHHISLHEGVFAGVLGPSFETPAEIRLLKTLGADVVSMSLIPEAIIARHCGLRIAAISAISNLAAGLHDEKLSHQVTLQGAQIASKNLIKLLSEFFKRYPATSS